MPNIPLMNELQTAQRAFTQLLAETTAFLQQSEPAQPNRPAASTEAVEAVLPPAQFSTLAPQQSTADLFGGAADTRVFVRCRPVLPQIDGPGQQRTVFSLPAHRDCLFLAPKIDLGGKASLEPTAIPVDGTFGPEADNAAVYERTCAPLVELAIKGGFSSLMAYGQTASGKSHTLTVGALPCMAARIDAALRETVVLTAAEQQKQHEAAQMAAAAAAKSSSGSHSKRVAAGAGAGGAVSSASRLSSLAAPKRNSAAAAAAAAPAAVASSSSAAAAAPLRRNDRSMTPTPTAHAHIKSASRGVSPAMGGRARTDSSAGSGGGGNFSAEIVVPASDDEDAAVPLLQQQQQQQPPRRSDSPATAAAAAVFADALVPAYRIEAAIIEISGAGCRDLLAPAAAASAANVTVVEAMDGSLQLLGATTIAVRTGADFLRVVEQARAARAVSATARNAGSSRTHMVARITIARADAPRGAQPGVICVADLAGSESTADSAHHDSKQIAEAKFINSSLMTLKECIRARSSVGTAAAAKHVHIPYRRSPLTLLLRDSFELAVRRPTKTVIIACVSPLLLDSRHTFNTLRYAQLLYCNPVAAVQIQADENDPHHWTRAQALAWLEGALGGGERGRQAAHVVLPGDSDDGRALVQLPEVEFIKVVMDATGYPEKRAGTVYQRLWKEIIDARSRSQKYVADAKKKALTNAAVNNSAATNTSAVSKASAVAVGGGGVGSATAAAATAAVAAAANGGGNINKGVDLARKMARGF